MSGVVDPVCGKQVDALRARAIGIFGGTTYYFCSAECKARFADPRRAERVVEAPAPVATKPVSPKPVTKPPPIVAPVLDMPPVEAQRLTDAPPSRSRPMLWSFALLAIVLAVVALTFFQSPTSRQPVAAVAPIVAAPPPAVTPPPIAKTETPPVKTETPPVKTETPPSSPTTVDASQPLRVGLRWFVTDRPDGATLVERLLVIDGAEHTTLYDIGRVELRANVATRDGSAPVIVQEAFTSSTSDLGILYEDTFAAGEVGLDVRVERTAEGLVASARAKGSTAWKRTLTVPLATDAKLRGAPFGKKRYEEAAAAQKE